MPERPHVSKEAGHNSLPQARPASLGPRLPPVAPPKSKSPPHSAEKKSVAATETSDLNAEESLDGDDDQRSSSSGRMSSPEDLSTGGSRPGSLGWDVYLNKLQKSVLHRSGARGGRAELPRDREDQARLPQKEEADLIACAATAAAQVPPRPIHTFCALCMCVFVCSEACAGAHMLCDRGYRFHFSCRVLQP